MTNLTILAGVAASLLTLLAWIVACIFLSKPEPAGLEPIIWLLTALITGGAALQIAKRATYNPTPPGRPDAEDTPAGKPTAVKALADLGLPAPIAPSSPPAATSPPLGPQNRNVTAEPGMAQGEGD